jgi:muramidase (phage lysozyme)
MDVELIQQINNQLREMNDLLGRQASAMSATIDATNKSTDAANKQKDSSNSSASVQRDAGTKYTAQTKLAEISREAADKTADANSKLSTAFEQGKTAFMGLAGALLDTTPGLTKYTSGVESATDAVTSVVSVFGPLGAVAGFLLKGLSALVGASFKYSDALVDAYDSVAKSGAGIGTSAEELVKLGHAARLSSGTLPYLTKNVEALGSDIRALGTTSSGGVEAFSRVIAVGEKQLKGYRNLGFTQEELIESQANYLKLQATAGADLKRSPEQLQKASLKYIDELNAFAEVTGISKKRQEDALAQAMAQENFNAYVNKLESDKKAALDRGDTAEAERIDGVIQAKQNLAKYAQANFSAAKAQAVLEGIATDGNTIMTENTAKLQQSGINIQKINANANKGIDQTGELAGQSAKSAEDFKRNFGEMGYAAGKESRNLQDAFFQDNGTRMAAARDADLKGDDRQKIFDKRMANARASAEAIKNKNSGITAQKAAVEAQERSARIAFDGLLAQLSAQLNGLLLKALPYITKLIQIVSDNFGLITTAAKSLAIIFAGLGAVAVAGKVIGSMRSLGSKVSGLFGKKTGAPGSQGNPMFIAFNESSGGLGGLTGGNKSPSDGGGGGGGGTSALKLAAKSAPQVLLGAATLGAAMVEMAAGLAAAVWLTGAALPKFATGLKEFEKLDGENLKNVGIGVAGLGAGILGLGAGGIAAAIGNLVNYFTGDKDPLTQSVEMLEKLQKVPLDRKRVEDNGASLVAFAKAMAAVAGLGAVSGIGTAIKGIYDGIANWADASSVMDDFVVFSKLDIDAKKTKNNAIAFKYFSEAMASFKGLGSPLGAIAETLVLATNSFFSSKPPLEQFAYFSNLDINKKKTKNNATSFKFFSEAMASYKGGQGLLSAVSTIAGAGLSKLFGQDSAVDSFYNFSKKDFGKNATVNSRAFLDFSKAMNILSGGSSSVLGDIANTAVTAGSAVVGAIAGAATVAGRALGIIPGPDGKAMNFIGKIESGGDYNKLVGGKNKTDPPLTSMTVAQVMDFQSGMRAKGHESTALGKYQIIKPTLAGLVKSGKVSPNAKFDQGLQDQAALSLMKIRGRDKFREGDITADKYADNLAKEWASLPMQNGKSFYAGTGSNKSLVSRSDFVTSLQAKAGGMFKGPTGGYPIELHGTELVIPVTPDSILSKLAEGTVDSSNMTDKILDTVTGMLNGDSPATEVDQFLELDNEMKGMLISKINKMLDVLDDKQSTSKKVFRSKVAS